LYHIKSIKRANYIGRELSIITIENSVDNAPINGALLFSHFTTAYSTCCLLAALCVFEIFIIRINKDTGTKEIEAALEN
jgi:hypothetical protein